MAMAQADPQYLIDAERLKAYQDASPTEKVVLRNVYIDERVLEIDYQFNIFLMELWRENTGMDLALDVADLHTGVLTALVGSASTKAALGAVSASITGTRLAYQKRVLSDAVLPALITKMLAEREKARLLLEKNKRHDAGRYSVYAAMRDLWAYYRAGTMLGAILAITEDAGADAVEAQTEMQRILEYERDKASDLLHDFLFEDDEYNADHAAQLLDWMRNNEVQADRESDITMFIYGAGFQEKRWQAVRDLNLHDNNEE